MLPSLALLTAIGIAVFHAKKRTGCCLKSEERDDSGNVVDLVMSKVSANIAPSHLSTWLRIYEESVVRKEDGARVSVRCRCVVEFFAVFEFSTAEGRVILYEVVFHTLNI